LLSAKYGNLADAFTNSRRMAIYGLLGHHVVMVPAPFEIGTTVFKEIYDMIKNKLNGEICPLTMS
jgi:hypothetical protein